MASHLQRFTEPEAHIIKAKMLPRLKVSLSGERTLTVAAFLVWCPTQGIHSSLQVAQLCPKRTSLWGSRGHSPGNPMLPDVLNF